MRLAFAFALIIGFSFTASAKPSELIKDEMALASAKIDPNDTTTFASLAVRCFAHAMSTGNTTIAPTRSGAAIHHIVNGNGMGPGGPAGLLQQCRAILGMGKKMTPEQFAKIRTKLLKTISDAKDEKYKEEVKSALFEFNKMESENRKVANSKADTEATN